MPCRDGGYDEEKHRRDNEHRMLAAALCGILRLGEDVLDRVDWKEAGASKGEVVRWWKAHQKADAERRHREEEARFMEAVRAAALSKLSKTERKALGLPE